ncbi:mCG64442, isoform CRA_b, partial [Mus musculus]
MLERGANSWFYSCETRTQREKEKRSQRLAEILRRYKEQLLKDFHLARVLPYLVYDGVFSLKEYREILSQARYPERVECFLLKLFSKGPSAFCAFCAHLEELSPYLLTSLFLYYQEQTQRVLQDVLVAEETARSRNGAQWDSSTVSDPEDQEQRARLFNKEEVNQGLCLRTANRDQDNERLVLTQVVASCLWETSGASTALLCLQLAQLCAHTNSPSK